LDTELLVLVTFLFVLPEDLTVVERVAFDGVDALTLDRVLTDLLLDLTVLLGVVALVLDRVFTDLLVLLVVLGVVTLVLEREVCALSLRLIDRVVPVSALRVVLVVLRVVVFSARRVERVLVISAFLVVTFLCIVRSVLFLGV
jgi:hypothetical protein